MLDLPIAFKRFRKTYGVTQKQVSLIANISERNYQDYEYGKVVPSVAILISISDYFNVSIDYLVGRTDNPNINR